MSKPYACTSSPAIYPELVDRKVSYSHGRITYVIRPCQSSFLSFAVDEFRLYLV